MFRVARLPSIKRAVSRASPNISRSQYSRELAKRSRAIAPACVARAASAGCVSPSTNCSARRLRTLYGRKWGCRGTPSPFSYQRALSASASRTPCGCSSFAARPRRQHQGQSLVGGAEQGAALAIDPRGSSLLLCRRIGSDAAGGAHQVEEAFDRSAQQWFIVALGGKARLEVGELLDRPYRDDARFLVLERDRLFVVAPCFVEGAELSVEARQRVEDRGQRAPVFRRALEQLAQPAPQASLSRSVCGSSPTTALRRSARRSARSPLATRRGSSRRRCRGADRSDRSKTRDRRRPETPPRYCSPGSGRRRASRVLASCTARPKVRPLPSRLS